MTDIVVKSLPDFLEQVFSNKAIEFYHDVADLRIMYRGQSNIGWNPLPAAFRTREDFLNEHFYIREYERQLSKECAGKTSIEILIDAQHYGIPTRLLDVTSNPLVALYFACSGHENEGTASDGVVIQFAPAGVFMQYDVTCSVYAEYVRRYKDGIHFSAAWKQGLTIAVQQSDSRFSFNASQAVKKMLSNEPAQLFLLPKYTNDRIAAQSGAFLLSATPFVEREDPGFGNGVFLYPDEVKEDFERKIDYRYVIPSGLKECFLSQLDSIGINEARLFPDVEHRAKSIVTAIRRTGRMNDSTKPK